MAISAIVPEPPAPTPSPKPVLIIGAGVSGLLLAQRLRRAGVPFRIFERDADLDTRGLGWGLTLHWSLPALRALLPPQLVRRLPESYVDRAAVEAGRPSTFPFYDVSTGLLVARTPPASETQRVRVSRQKLRKLLATGLNIEWNKAVKTAITGPDGSVTVTFDDGSAAEGSLVAACDGGSSRLRAALFPDQPKHLIPVRLLGVRIDCTPEEIAPLRELDAYFLQGTSSMTDVFVYFSILDTPHNHPSGNGNNGKYTVQMVVSWPVRSGFLGREEPLAIPDADADRIALIQGLAETWAEPFRSIARLVAPDASVKALELYDWPPPKGLRTQGHVALVGDAVHPMTMYRGEGANHAIVDVLDLAEKVILPWFQGQRQRQAQQENGNEKAAALPSLRAAIDAYEDAVVARARPAVLASRQAALDAHRWRRITDKSPLLTKRGMCIQFDEEGMTPC
ncbi:hypothetical protein VTJ83DRAFT_1380 [Remersonia thermophila]|uniref:FAD-binding domain-containing protein n=1 Tax=Remersonia thermophila TaxID=72144 RepID=A0ABR4DRZ0_9PEZI